VILWSEEQARLLRARRFAELDIEHLADEIEDVAKAKSANWRAVWLSCWLTSQMAKPTRGQNQELAGDDRRPTQARRARAQGDAEP
jgi:hypothetical protein